MADTHAPLLKYTKIYFASYLIGFGYGMTGGFTGALKQNKNALESHKAQTAVDYVKQTNLGGGFRVMWQSASRPAAIFAVGSTFYGFLLNTIRDFGYSTSQAALRASAIIAPMIVFYKYDRPFTNFFYRSVGVFFIISK
jgi:hypothetical protein